MKKQPDAEYIAFEFRTKQISVIEKGKEKQFQQMFVKSGFELYVTCELVEVELPKKTEIKKADVQL
ncbi:hypothetical protein Glove_680g13 [Diversispora epigaea]|uniref:Uncharacterized protein n=1 Tax=Diversispora epigaea TaxID=1348612 RepID=A0A397G6D2_9GLOM|nr:hypothetical protein Glove_680g13 [Diversispora epigaea]